MAQQVSLTGVAPGSVLAERYRIDHVVPSVGAQRAYIGTALQTGQYVMLLEVGGSAASLLGRALLVAHPNLATLLELINVAEGGWLAVVEYPEGMTLKERLETGATLPTDKAVSYALCVSHGLAALHQRGAAHGLLRPASVVLSPQARGGAVLAYAPPVPPPNPFRTPERGLGAPSPADDVWGLAALLHHMLVGKPPPTFGVRAPDELIEAGIQDAYLRDLIADCLRPQTAHRITIVGAVRDALLDWARGRVDEAERAQRKADSMLPAALDGSSVVGATIAPPPVGAPEATGSRGVPTLLGGIAVGVLLVAAVAAVVLLRPDLVQSVMGDDPAPAAPTQVAALPALPPEASASATPAPSVSAVAEAEAVSADSLLSGEQLTACVVRQLPDDSVFTEVDFDWLCITDDPRKGNSRMRVALVAASGSRQLTPAMDLWSRMRWYGMAGFAVLRSSCCSNAEPLKLPKLTGCDPLEEILDELGAAVARGDDHEAELNRYSKSIKCNMQLGRGYLLRQKGGIGGGQRGSFLKLLKAREGD